MSDDASLASQTTMSEIVRQQGSVTEPARSDDGFAACLNPWAPRRPGPRQVVLGTSPAVAPQNVLGPYRTSASRETTTVWMGALAHPLGLCTPNH